ncbi:MAG: multicopper oxidase family protein [Bacillota bacterium]|jgi:FtsP/CotA-like multicopper oxidase with cupredoxin domain|uniref:multicopper oxidase family protein n=1 Tax=Fictibacillus TaxID=1329200 RepID=UPI0018CFE535|nr:MULTISPECIES: multicopper oxidase family protein [unclassified Fictibacillus]MBH0157212.1 multicopper oxidase family protein [Fictibacillus sp. 5RED26]MBH0159533.1 multicopper oxidase family protein [Fictibacillus sp. 26RED30]MBH0163668.1 multicopper oxidase family protein [Fictibacillus sp. 7GRE50]MBH0169706.1 multicopper oxidase family protein [Fictibacillus sp. 18YEL24]MBH0174206.1 multicopper oxidase family protein [Fictibacillus sp. 23RED33]
MKKQWLISLMLLVLILVITGCSQEGSKDQSNENKVQAKEEILEGKTIKEFSITAKKENWELKSGKTIEAWTYNGSVPGQEIRVKEGEGVKVTIKNELPKPVSIHWHGVPLSNTQDGIPGVTQDAIETGKEYTYQFVADTPGTYWYHSHQDSVNQVDKGLYGVFIVESKDDEQYDRDYSLVLDEWESNPKQESEEMDGMDHSNMDMNESDTEDMEGMDHSNMDMGDKKNKDSKSSDNGSMNGMDHDMSSYDIYTINGKSYDKSKPLIAKKGEKVKLRFVNAGYMSHKIHIPLNFKVTNVDGQPVNQPIEQENKVLEVAPGERYDIEFIATGETVTIDCHGEMDASKDMRINIQAEEEAVQPVAHKKDAGMVKPDEFGKEIKGNFSLNDSFDLEYKMDLATDMDSGEMKYTINGNTYPKTENIKVDKGDKVKVTLTNKSMDKSDHPMHLHGHFFQVLSKNGKPVEGAPLMKDTLNVKPGETYEVAFVADNPGNWMFHCHDLHHASAGMMTMVKYNNFKPFYKDEGKVNNISE